MRIARTILALTLLAPATAVAQGALGNQGFGFPVGQLSTGARAAGGSNAETDPNSPINPAAITQSSRFAVRVQFEPEFRRTTVPGSGSASASVARFPGFAASGAYRRLVYQASVSSFLDRTWSNQYDDSLLVGGDWVQSTIRTSSDGAIGDVRLALGYVAHRRLQVGVGLHGFSGANRVTFVRTFPDTSGVGSIAQSSSIGYSGRAVSAGIVAVPVDGFVLAASARFGGTITADQAGTAVGEGTVPSRIGVGFSWLAARGISVNGRFDRTQWTDIDPLGSAEVVTFDADEFGLGVELLGPPVSGVNSVLRLGVRDRGLPFGVNGSQVSERAYSGGLGIPFARGRAQFDAALERAKREGAGATERSWVISLGIGIRP